MTKSGEDFSCETLILWASHAAFIEPNVLPEDRWKTLLPRPLPLGLLETGLPETGLSTIVYLRMSLKLTKETIPSSLVMKYCLYFLTLCAVGTRGNRRSLANTSAPLWT
ncbi:hypothetical protein MT325_m239L [Paramecium bursaria chlorella virus MT325]|uniref:Uncharacterized protein m239L n=1 Tax=Paramecium bursaria Chlorella virus MT325 TaxID=346932 RepID=A7ITW9_PBCVM|nr:hypothetical protein MT325_m239L [Paramecium bursaria chlorella virus MT325]